MAKKTGFSAEAKVFAQSLLVSCPQNELKGEDVHDDLKRENYILAQALAAAVKAKSLLSELGFGFGAPEGYFCEMLKTEEQMSKIKKRVDEKVASKKASEDARKQRQLKKFGKKVQTETLMERAKQKKEDLAKIAQMRKKRKVAESTDAFDIDVDSGDEGTTVQKRKVIKNGKKTLVDKPTSGKRDYKDKKYGFGGKKWDTKRNTKDSVDDFDFNPGKNKRAFAGVPMKGGKKVGKRGTAARPGKQRRQQMRNKAASKRR